ncbi:MAG: nuclear transport factor 2 family protein [Porticoccaceae bacterium]|nr:nuclear transport factor 2 family protein [Porticoccaceae bacterium]MDG1306611.1 nuclear transport factor 2 family protein [Porticoccaceae bacterium]
MPINTLATWHQVAKDRDIEGLYNLLDDNVVFHSPVVHTPQEGKAITGKYLSAAFDVFFNESFTYVREVSSEGQAILEFEVEIQGVKVNGVDMISWNQTGLITEFKVMVRPLKAVSLIHQNMGAMLQAAQ